MQSNNDDIFYLKIKYYEKNKKLWDDALISINNRVYKIKNNNNIYIHSYNVYKTIFHFLKRIVIVYVWLLIVEKKKQHRA